MTTLTDVASALKTLLVTGLSDVDYSSITEYSPPLRTQKIALLIVPFGQSGMMQYGMLGRESYIHAHRLPVQFWVKGDLSRVDTGIQRARDIVLSALRVIAADPSIGGTVLQLGSSLLGNLGEIGRYDIQPLFNERDQIPYIVATLYVPFEIREIAAI
jgi:hypothetical protein